MTILPSVRIGTAAFALAALAFAPAGAAPAATPVAGAIINPGDQLAIAVYGEPMLSQTTTVLADSTIEYPMIGSISLRGETPAQAAITLRRAFARYVRAPIVSVGVVVQGQLTVMVLGNVKTPGKYVLPFNSHVTDALAAAGGLGPTDGPYPEARITSVNGVHDAPLQAILRGGESSADITLDNDAVVYVPSPVTFSIHVLGAVDRPGEISVSQGDRLSTAIAKAGNSVAANADLNDIRVTREAADGTTTVFKVNLYDALAGGQTATDLQLQKNDVVYVPQAKKNGSALTGNLFGLLGRFLF
jgi:polysaccharide export outer membrane protein